MKKTYLCIFLMMIGTASFAQRDTISLNESWLFSIWYLSDKTDNYLDTKAYNIPDVQPGEKVYVEVDDRYNGQGIVTVVRPNGYVVSQKSFYITLD